jgi:hypothetical protein
MESYIKHVCLINLGYILFWGLWILSLWDRFSFMGRGGVVFGGYTSRDAFCFSRILINIKIAIWCLPNSPPGKGLWMRTPVRN